MEQLPAIHGLTPDALAPRTRKIVLEDFVLPVDVGFHDFEVGAPQNLSLTIEVWVDERAFPDADDPKAAWDYDFLRTEVRRLVDGRRYNLQETLVREIYDRVAARRGVTALRISARKRDVYADCGGVGVELASF